MAFDERLIGALHVEAYRAREPNSELHPHEVFQSSTIGSLLDGAYDGDVSFAELAAHGDLGLGTFDACDGEMIALDGEFLRADVEGALHAVAPERRTPFAVVTFFQPTHRFELEGPLTQEELLARIDAELGHPSQVHALRVDGRFERVRARSVARQSKPYRPLTEVVADQHVFELGEVDGTLVGFRFPDYAAGLNVPGYHLHFASADRSRGGHVLDCVLRSGTAAADDSTEVRVELPPDVELGAPAARLGGDDAVRRVEREG